MKLGRRHLGFWLLLALTLICLVWGYPNPDQWSAPAQARSSNPKSPSVQELRQWQQRLREYRTGVSQQRQQLQQIEDAARDRLQGLEQNVRLTSRQIRQSEQTLSAATKALAELESQLKIAEAHYQERLTATVARLRLLQRWRPQNTWATLLASRDLGQFLQRQHQLQQVYRADQQLLTNLKADYDRVQMQQQQMLVQIDQMQQLRQRLRQQKVAFASEAAQQQQLVNQIITDRQGLEAAENQLERDSEAITAMLRQRLAYVAPTNRPDEVFTYGSGRLGYPIRAPITSNFGWRVHPILGTSRFHSGTDFGADFGTPIRAAEAGTVVVAGWQGGYGNTVILDHGGGMTTLYGHCSQLYVKEGETVVKGQTIAAVGSTGMSTGPHLHFEVRINGEPRQPMDYLGRA